MKILKCWKPTFLCMCYNTNLCVFFNKISIQPKSHVGSNSFASTLDVNSLSNDAMSFEYCLNCDSQESEFWKCTWWNDEYWVHVQFYWKPMISCRIKWSSKVFLEYFETVVQRKIREVTNVTLCILPHFKYNAATTSLQTIFKMDKLV